MNGLSRFIGDEGLHANEENEESVGNDWQNASLVGYYQFNNPAMSLLLCRNLNRSIIKKPRINYIIIFLKVLRK